jgi:2'-5' RNA ligase
MRLFIAIDLEEEAKRELRRLQEALKQFDRDVRWVTRDQMHLTLVFLGEVADAKLPSVSTAVEQATDKIGPFEITLAGSGCFPPAGKVRVVWAGVEESTGALAKLQAACADNLEAEGFLKDSRPFSPHLTLGRVKSDTTDGKLRAAADELTVEMVLQPVSAVRVVQSKLTPHGSRYRTVAQSALRG